MRAFGPGLASTACVICSFISLVAFAVFFFFQAEDGIRDHCVTGVQTCALPICAGPTCGVSQRPPVRRTWAPRGETPVLIHAFNWAKLSLAVGLAFRWDFRRSRSEERRVGSGYILRF